MTLRIRPTALLALALASACGGPRASGAGAAAAGGPGGSAPTRAATAAVRPLAALAAQRVVVTPAFAVREGDPLGWAAGIPRQREWLRQLDDEIAFALGERGVAAGWVLGAALARGFARNPSLSPDPQRLAVAPLRALAKVGTDARLPEPLATQLRTLVAVHDGRFVLLPTEVVFERVGNEGGRAQLRLALVDARASEVRWLGEVRSDPSPTFHAGVAASLAARLADLIAAP